MRIRTVKPELFTHDELFDLEKRTKLPLRIAFIGIWCFCDREGRFKWKPRQMKPCILPHDNLDFDKVLEALRGEGFIVQYEHQEESYGFVPSFLNHQFINNKEAKSSLPDPFSPLSRVKDACLSRLGSSQGERKGKEGEGKSERVDDATSPWLLEQGIELPKALQTQNCLDAAKKWLMYKREKSQPYKPMGLQGAVTKWANEFNAATFPMAVENSIAQNYQGIFPPKSQQQQLPAVANNAESWKNAL